MTNKISLLLLCVMMLLSACDSSHIIINWKGQHIPESYSKILVAGIVKDQNDSLRMIIEKNIVNELRRLGYNAVSSIKEYGPLGLANMGQEQTYIKLCDNGIDEVMTIALIDQSKEKNAGRKNAVSYSNNYYYNRIWNYKNIEVDLTNNKNNEGKKYFWESILFNLRTLETECTVQTEYFTGIKKEKIVFDYEKKIIKRMIQEKIISNNSNVVKKPF